MLCISKSQEKHLPFETTLDPPHKFILYSNVIISMSKLAKQLTTLVGSVKSAIVRWIFKVNLTVTSLRCFTFFFL